MPAAFSLNGLITGAFVGIVVALSGPYWIERLIRTVALMMTALFIVHLYYLGYIGLEMFVATLALAAAEHWPFILGFLGPLILLYWLRRWLRYSRRN